MLGCSSKQSLFLLYYDDYKGSSRVTLPNGAYSSSLDRLDQGLDLIKEATANAGFQFSVDVGVMIQVGSEAIYDEVSSPLKCN